MIKIEIKKQEVQQVPFTYKQGPRQGEPGMIRKQSAYVHLGDHYPERIEISLPDDMPNGWPSGEYTLDEKSFYVGRFSKLEIGNLMLIPIRGALKPASNG